MTNLVYGDNFVTQPPFEKYIFQKILLKCSQCSFMFDDKLYQKIDGVSMGGPLAPSMANAFLAHLENNLLNDNTHLSCIPKLFLRYVDDCFALFDNEDDAILFLNVLNSLHSSINFTLEKGNDCMPFLDVAVKISGDSFVTSIYRKSTHTGVFLNFLASAPTAWKKGLIMCLLHRTKLICSNVTLFNAEVDNLRKMFISNSYPVSFFNNVLSNFIDNRNRTLSENSNTDDQPSVIFSVPYFGKCSRDFANDISKLISRKFDVKVRIVYSTFKVKSYFVLKCFHPYTCRPILFIDIIA